MSSSEVSLGNPVEAVTLGRVWRLLQDIPDPEIPPVSIVDLGMVRAVEWTDDSHGTLVVRITPTYSGCPATDLIVQCVRERLHEHGVASVTVEIALAPAWNTGWVTSEGRRKLREYGIAPPDAGQPSRGAVAIDVAGLGPLRRPQVTVPCPRCGARSTRLVAQFGSTACKAQYVCNDCLEPFDHFKQH